MNITTLRETLEKMLLIAFILVAVAMLKYEGFGEKWLVPILFLVAILFWVLLGARIYEVIQKRK